ncbi:hypothetical protein PoB_006756200 [Plakobranchus ocellatus]|uniref:Uncharacterized protein n=1 Tax=Plakobranchus ocellatus TaxID=259542 RepID=A0AAV4D9Y5_9GAST|nr:hypothetical protein PoB_006756200 [Plakobranchus ocellatus]
MFAIRAKMKQKVKGDCSDLLACENTISDADVISEDHGLVSMMNEAEAVDYICMELGTLTSCITNRFDTCDDAIVKNDVRMSKDNVEYMCSDEGRPEIYQYHTEITQRRHRVGREFIEITEMSLYSDYAD